MAFTYPSGVQPGWRQNQYGSGGYRPGQLDSLIANDPFYMQLKALIDAQSQTDATKLGSNLSQLLVDFGEVPAGFTSSYLPDTTAALASQNTAAGLSLLARLNRQAEDARRGSINDLAARGILSSGETGWQLGRLAQARKETEYDARRQLLDTFNQMNDAFAAAELQRKLALIDASISAYGRQASRQANLNYGGGY